MAARPRRPKASMEVWMFPVRVLQKEQTAKPPAQTLEGPARCRQARGIGKTGPDRAMIAHHIRLPAIQMWRDLTSASDQSLMNRGESTETTTGTTATTATTAIHHQSDQSLMGAIDHTQNHVTRMKLRRETIGHTPKKSVSASASRTILGILSVPERGRVPRTSATIQVGRTRPSRTSRSGKLSEGQRVS